MNTRWYKHPRTILLIIAATVTAFTLIAEIGFGLPEMWAIILGSVRPRLT